MSFAFCRVPVAAMRKEPDHRSEMVSQLLFGERADLTNDRNGPWIRLCSAHDGYEGWCQEAQLLPQADQPSSGEILLTSEWAARIGFDDQSMWVPLGSTLEGFQGGLRDWGRHRLRYSGSGWHPDRTDSPGRAVEAIAFRHLNTPYLWGGRSVFGMDCSGLTQAAYRWIGIGLPRDTHLQASCGTACVPGEPVQTGDLAFFDNAEGRITHVGILLVDRRIIHAAGRVRIDSWDERGIVHAETGELTHRASGRRRLW